MHRHRASTSPKGQGAVLRVPNDAYADSQKCSRLLLVVDITVTGQDVALELFLIRVPELGGLGVQWACAVRR